MEAYRLQAGVDAAHVPVVVGAEGQGMEDDVGELLHGRGHDHDHGRDDAPWLPNDRVHALPREEDSVGRPWEYEPLFPVLFPSPSPGLCLCPGPCPYLDLARGHGLCSPCQGQGQGQTKEQELQTTTLGQLQRSHGRGVCYSHDHALFPYQAAAAAAVVSSTSPALRRHLAGRPSVGEREDPERVPEVG